jgi:hypothetical protein
MRADERMRSPPYKYSLRLFANSGQKDLLNTFLVTTARYTLRLPFATKNYKNGILHGATTFNAHVADILDLIS